MWRRPCAQAWDQSPPCVRLGWLCRPAAPRAHPPASVAPLPLTPELWASACWLRAARPLRMPACCPQGPHHRPGTPMPARARALARGRRGHCCRYGAAAFCSHAAHPPCAHTHGWVGVCLCARSCVGAATHTCLHAETGGSQQPHTSAQPRRASAVGRLQPHLLLPHHSRGVCGGRRWRWCRLDRTLIANLLAFLGRVWRSIISSKG